MLKPLTAPAFISAQLDGALLALGADGDDGAVFKSFFDNRQQRIIVAWNSACAEGFQHDAFQTLRHNGFKETELNAWKYF